jgi:hypothetical protein
VTARGQTLHAEDIHMRFRSIIFTFLAAAALLAVVASPVSAKRGGDGDGDGDGGGVATPGPIAGAGLGYLALAGGGYYVVRRWRRKQKTGE